MSIQVVLTLGKRILVVLGVIAVLYFGIGSLIYGEWFYGLLWDAKFWSLHYWLDGLFFLFDRHTYAVILVLVLALALAVVTSKYRHRVWPFVDRFWLWLVAAFSLAVFATALLVFRFEGQAYEGLTGLETAVAKLDTLMRNMGKVDHLLDIEPPIDFHYVDQERVNSLYSELTPEMEESERKISAHSSVTGKAGLSSGSISGEVGASKDASTESALKRTSYTSERKCIEIMRFVLSHERANYYTNGGAWFIQRIFRDAQESYVKAKNQPTPREITKEDLEKLRLPATKEQEEAAKRRAEEHSQEFQKEMESLVGLAIVDGQFSVKRISHDSLSFSEEYSENPLHIVFRAVAPSGPELGKLLTIRSTRLRVFGTVVKPYGKDGVIELRPLAIF